MLTIKTEPMMLSNRESHNVMDEAGYCLGGLATAAGAQLYKARLEAAGVICAEDLLARVKDPAYRETMRGLMALEVRA